MTSNPTPAPQPLTDEEVEELLKLHGNANSSPKLEHRGYTRVDVDEDDAEFYKAAYSKVPFLVARIRADGRRIRELEENFKQMREYADRMAMLDRGQSRPRLENFEQYLQDYF